MNSHYLGRSDMIIFAQPIEQFPHHLRFDSVPTEIPSGSFYSVEPEFPLKNLLSYDITDVMKTNFPYVEFKWDFGRRRKFDVVSLLSSNISPRSEWRIYASNDGSNWTTLHDGPFYAHQSAIYPDDVDSYNDEDIDMRKGSFERNSSFKYFPTVQNYRYLRFAVSNSGAGELDFNMTFGRLFVGRSFRPKTSYQYGSSLRFDDTSVKDRTDQGALVLSPRKTIVGASVKMDFLSSDEMYEYIYDFNYWRGSAREMLCCLDVNTTHRLSKNLLYATISEGRTVTADSFNAWSQTWILESI